MFNSLILEVAIGIVFIYLLISLICTIVNEWISEFFKIRVNMLKEWIKNFLEKPELIDNFYKNPLIKSLQEKEKRLPSYIPSDIFVKTLLESVNVCLPKENAKANISALIQKANIPSKNLEQSLLMLVDHVSNSVKETINNIEKFFNSAMERVSGWYKRKIQIITLVMSLLITAGLNIDTISLIREFVINDELRTIVTNNAQIFVEKHQNDNTDDNVSVNINEIKDELTKNKLPIGWKYVFTDEKQLITQKENLLFFWLIKTIGILVSATAVSLGAPFWFDILKKIINLRSTGVKPGKKEDK